MGVDVVDIRFNPAGDVLFALTATGELMSWTWRTEALIAEACARLPRNLTVEEWQRFLGDEPFRTTCPSLHESAPLR
jgi:hypothetical protein